MIFDCGENWKAQRERLSDWHSFFPLFPRTVKVENGRDICAWLHPIERKGQHYSSWGESFWLWEYRLPPSAAKEVKP